jgi:hypothetical protein
MRVIEAFSWVLFGVCACRLSIQSGNYRSRGNLTILVAIFFAIVVNLASTAVERGGRPYAWREPMIELPWFGEWPGYSGGPNSAYPTMHMAEGGMVPGGYYPGNMIPAGGPISTMPVRQDGGYVVQQQPGYSMIITPGPNGQAPTIQQVPGRISSV